jgi:hypothetical protein
VFQKLEALLLMFCCLHHHVGFDNWCLVIFIMVLVSFSRSMYNECKAKCFLEQSHKISHVFPILSMIILMLALVKVGLGVVV